MRRPARAALAVLAAFLLATPAPAPPAPGPGVPATAILFAEPVPLNPEAPDQARLGPLRYLGGWSLASNDRRFGAISALAVEGRRVLALGDIGILFRFAVPERPGQGQVDILPIAAGPGAAASKIDRDSESLVLHAGSAWVGYENSNQIWRYRSSDWSPAAHAAPATMKRWSRNAGAEAMLRLPDGRFLVFGETVNEEGTSPAVLFAGDPAIAATAGMAVRYRPPASYRITEAALLPDGRLILLSRALSLSGGWSAKLITAALPRTAGEVIPTQELATLEAPLTRDNMEGLAVTQEAGRTILWMASDDNLNDVQRSLLLKFEWAG